MDRKGFRFYYDKPLEFLIQEELIYTKNFLAVRNAKQRQRMYANLFCRDMRKVLVNEQTTCNNCGLGGPFHIDHIIPISKGGTNTPENIQILCKWCNLSKRDQIW